LVEERTRLAGTRTVMAADRTLMGWVRTGMSMITFGFTVYKLLNEVKASGVVLPNDNTPRNLGLFLIGVGTLSMIVGKIEYWQTVGGLDTGRPIRIWRPSFIMALVMSVAGLGLFFGILVRVL
jgi:putative membrane protein